MARWTQYIGLSPEALDFLDKHPNKVIGSWKMATGITFEDVMGSIYEVESGEDPYGGTIIETFAEVEDVTPWSSGPMIHTALRNLSTGEKMFVWKDEDIHDY